MRLGSSVLKIHESPLQFSTSWEKGSDLPNLTQTAQLYLDLTRSGSKGHGGQT